MSDRCAERRRVARFTLVEMLVVIAVIGILAALLMPALQRSLAVAKTVDCTNRQKQLYTTFCLFANDHDGILPLAVYNATAAAPYQDSLFPPEGALSGNQYGFAFPYQSRNFLTPYLSSMSSISCPADPYTAGYDAEKRNWLSKSSYQLPMFRFSYCAFFGTTFMVQIQRFSRLIRPSQLVMLMEKDQNASDAGRNYFKKGYPAWFATFGYHHNGNTGFNALFSDGHVKFIHLDHEVTYAVDYKDNYLYIPGELDKNNWE